MARLDAPPGVGPDATRSACRQHTLEIREVDRASGRLEVGPGWGATEAPAVGPRDQLRPSTRRHDVRCYGSDCGVGGDRSATTRPERERQPPTAATRLAQRAGVAEGS